MSLGLSLLTGRVEGLKESVKKTFPRTYAQYLQWQYRRTPVTARIAPILASTRAPMFYDGEFERLQQTHAQWWPDYGYDSYSTWARGCERAIKLLLTPELRSKQLTVLEAGCGDGMTSYALTTYGNVKEICLNDTQDWRDERAKSFAFIPGDMCEGVAVSSSTFDLVITYNTFEHVRDPGSALRELLRVCKPGGVVYIDFNPLYCSPLGLHAFSFRMPYAQFLFSPSLIQTKVRELGVDDLGRSSDSLQPTNQWRISQFRELWKDSGCDIVHMVEVPEQRHLATVLEFPAAFQGRNLTVDDLEIAGIAVMMRKPSGSTCSLSAK
jgi:SAM-dependent methyltransferase